MHVSSHLSAIGYALVYMTLNFKEGKL